jgi:hypothetical protein
MHPVDPSLLRVSLKHFLGEPQYRKFLEAGAKEPLRYWQERAWAQFIERYPELAATATERADALNVCPAHERPLSVGYTESPEGKDLHRTPEERELFPRSPLLPVGGGIHRVLYCPVCVSEEEQYRHQQRRKKQSQP